MEAQNQRTDTPADLLHCGRTVRSSHWRYSIKEAVLKNFAIFIGLQFFKKKLQQRCFLWILQNFYNYPFQKTSANDCFFFTEATVSMVLGYMPKASTTILYNSIRLHGPSHWS